MNLLQGLEWGLIKHGFTGGAREVCDIEQIYWGAARCKLGWIYERIKWGNGYPGIDLLEWNQCRCIHCSMTKGQYALPNCAGFKPEKLT